MNLLYFGMLGELSRAPLAALLRAGRDVRAVLVPAQGPPPHAPITRLKPAAAIPLLQQPQTILDLAWQHGIPAFAVAALDAAPTLEALAAFDPDLACVSCFNRRIPPALLALPRRGFLNLHPGFLPWQRGPAPLFWTFQQGLETAGLTLHLMDEGFDTGPILLQERLALPDGIGEAAAERRYAGRGGELMLAAVDGLEHGSLVPQPQPAGGSYAPWPQQGDFAIDAAWPARRAFNFMRGTANWNQPYALSSAGRSFLLHEAIRYDPEVSLAAAFSEDRGRLLLRCNPGLLEATQWAQKASLSAPIASDD